MFAAILASIVAVVPTPAASPLVNPYQIFADARAYWERQRYPTMVGYTIHVTASQRGAVSERHYMARWSAQTNAVAIEPVSIEEQQHPFRPAGGFTFGIVAIASLKIGGTGTGINGDAVGLPIVAPNYFFDIASYVPPREATPAELVAQIREQFHDPAPAKIAQLEASSVPPTIATVTASHHDYDIELLGVDPYGDHRDYHLGLKPVEDPKKYRLRELWINTDTFATDKLINQGNFTEGPSLDVPWTVTFDDVAGARYITQEVADAPLHTEGQEYTVVKSHPGVYDTWMVSFEDITPVSGPFLGGNSTGPTLTEPL